MQIIRELNEEFKVLKESVDGEKRLYLEGVIIQTNIVNKNKRLYPKGLMEQHVNKYITEQVEKNKAWGELSHPKETRPSIDIDRISHRFTSIKESGDNYVGKAIVVTKNPMGQLIEGLIDAGGAVGMSTRAMGSVKKNSKGINEVTQMYLVTAGDVVTDPSAPDAYMNSIMENKEWVYVNGEWLEETFDSHKKQIIKATPAQLDALGIHLFNEFVSGLKNL